MKLIRALYLKNLFFFLLFGVGAMYVVGFFIPVMYSIATPILLAVLLLLGADIAMLFASNGAAVARRDTMDKLSNGDENKIQILTENTYPFPIRIEVIDELPFQFQARDISYRFKMSPMTRKVLEYKLRPTKRGVYHFGSVNVFVTAPLGLASRRYRYSADLSVPVYPSFLQMRKYELMAISNRLQDLGVKKIRRVAQNREFDQIKEYVIGDDIRTVNWKSTARMSRLMVNQYQDERSQPVYNLVDMGRLMKMPFNELSLLDYAINSSLVLSNIALHKQDRAGLITFSNRVHTAIPASKRNNQLQLILEALYNQKTGYLESDYGRLYMELKSKLNQRSLLLLYTNFETLSGLHRQLGYLRLMAKDHLLVVIFFDNTELKEVLKADAKNTEEVYRKIIAEKLAFEKKQIVKELQQYGIHSILSTPENLTVNAINKYLELKARGFI